MIATRPQQVAATSLAELADGLAASTDLERHGDLDVAVTGISLSTARTQPGDVYAALPGTRAHGADFAAQALEAGAVGVLTDAAGLDRLPPGVPAVVVEDPRRVLGRLAAAIYGDPATRLRVIGVTGTQGKTTTTRLLEQALTTSGVPAAVVGTVGTRIAGQDVKTELTTPEAPDLHGLFAVMAEQGVDTCAMEVSSHALVLGRVDGVVFDVATFLNLGSRPPRLPPRRRRLLRRQGQPLHARARRARPDERRRRVRPPAPRRRDDPDVDVLLRRSRRRLARHRRRAVGDGRHLHRARAGRRGARRGGTAR